MGRAHTFIASLLYSTITCMCVHVVYSHMDSHVVCSLLTIMKFGLDESTRREPTDLLVHSANNNYQLVAR